MAKFEITNNTATYTPQQGEAVVIPLLNGGQYTSTENINRVRVVRVESKQKRGQLPNPSAADEVHADEPVNNIDFSVAWAGNGPNVYYRKSGVGHRKLTIPEPLYTKIRDYINGKLGEDVVEVITIREDADGPNDVEMAGENVPGQDAGRRRKTRRKARKARKTRKSKPSVRRRGY